jgi:septum formation protein
MGIVLASGSPRRRELLAMLGVQNLIILPAAGEESAPPGLTPDELVKHLSRQKAAEVQLRCTPDDIVIAADTVVSIAGDILGKPRDREDAVRMLQALSGRTHQVFTGVTVLRGAEAVSEAEMTAVRFRTLDAREIGAYVDTGEPMDKAGAYGAQGLAALFVEGIRGDFFNVMGLPLCRLGTILKKMGVNLL